MVALAATACASPEQRRETATVLFLTDFGLKDGAVAACKGVMVSIAPALRIVDLTHDIPPYDIEAAAEVLEQALPFYPSGTVAVAVVDPGVGSERKAAAILTKQGHILVGPDNGIFTLVMQTEGVERAVELRNTRYFRAAQTSSTFHGRDVFAPVAAHLAAGVPLDSLGPPLVPVRLDLRRPGSSRAGSMASSATSRIPTATSSPTSRPRCSIHSAQGWRLARGSAWLAVVASAVAQHVQRRAARTSAGAPALARRRDRRWPWCTRAGSCRSRSTRGISRRGSGQSRKPASQYAPCVRSRGLTSTIGAPITPRTRDVRLTAAQPP